jgi:glucose-1-phosphate adenylyltransferase
MTRNILALVLAGGRVEELSVLTMLRPKAAVPFGGQYRIVDFALTSLMRADIERVGVIGLYRPSSLIDHLGIGEPWDMVGRGRGVKILPPYQAEGDVQGYRGTADALYQNLAYIERYAPSDVLVLSGDHIHGMDLRPFIMRHRESGADLTMALKAVDPDSGHGRFGFAELGPDSKVTVYQEKPARPVSNLASLTIYMFKTDALVRRLAENQQQGSSFHLSSEVIPRMVEGDNTFAYTYDGYWNYTRSLGAYHQANMDLLGEEPLIDLDAWGIRSRRQYRGLGDLPPALFRDGCACSEATVARGSMIAGSVTRSVIGPNVKIASGAHVYESVLMDGVSVGPDASVYGAILDKEVEVAKGAHIGRKEHSDGEITVIGKRAVVAAGERVAPGAVVAPGTTGVKERQ